MRDIFNADQNGGAGRTPRTRYLGATAALAMAEPVAESYRQVTLVEPLAQHLKLKKAKMEETLKAYSVAADYGVADVTTAATYRIATRLPRLRQGADGLRAAEEALEGRARAVQRAARGAGLPVRGEGPPSCTS